MASGSASMADGLNKVLGQISTMMIHPDADLDFLSQLQMAITQYIRAGSVGSMAAGAPGGGMGAGMAGGAADQNTNTPGVQPTPPGAGMVPPGPQGMGGAMPGPAAPNPDELRRMLSTVAGGQGG